MSNPPTQSGHNQVKSTNSVWTRPQHRKSCTKRERCYNTLANYLNIPITDVYIYTHCERHMPEMSELKSLKLLISIRKDLPQNAQHWKKAYCYGLMHFSVCWPLCAVFQPGKCMSCGSDWVKRMSRADSFIIKPTTAPLQRKKQRETSERRDGA